MGERDSSSKPLTRLAFVGDVMLGRLVNRALRDELPTYPWGDTIPILQRADCRICNLECVLSDRGRPWSETLKVFHFRSDARNVKVLKAADIDVVSLANNHVLDYEYDALGDMFDLLQKEHIRYAGAGLDANEARQAVTWNLNRPGQDPLRLGLLAFTDNEPSWEATDSRPGLFYSPIDLDDLRAIDLLRRVRIAKKRVDFLIVSTHWGPNWGWTPPVEHVPFAHALIDAGADMVYGHSPHIFRGIEFYRGKAILYGTGDFIDDYAVDEIDRNDQSFIFMLELAGDQLSSIRLFPTVIRAMQAQSARPPDRDLIIAKMRELCHAFGTSTEIDFTERVLVVHPTPDVLMMP